MPSIHRASHARLRECAIHDFSKISPTHPWKNILQVSASEPIYAMLTQKGQIRYFQKAIQKVN